MSNVAKDYPLDECARAAAKLVSEGWTVHQKFTCVGCGSRQTMGTPNVFYAAGSCEECGRVTNIRERGCNYVLMNF